MTFAHAMNARYYVRKSILSKAKEKGMNKNMYILLDGETDYPDHPA